MNTLAASLHLLKLSVRRLGSPHTCGRKFHRLAGFQSCAPQNFQDYESLRQLYRPEAPEYFNFAKDVLDRWAEREKDGERPSNPALWWVNNAGEEIKWSFEELGVRSRRAANILAGACDLQPRDRLLLILPRVPEWWLVNVACLRTGTVLIPGTAQLTAKDILHRLLSSSARCIVTDESLAPLVDAVAAECPFLKAKLLVSQQRREGWLNFTELSKAVSSDHTCVKTKSSDPMTIFFTSGTTGSPKMTQHSHCSFGVGLAVNGRYWLDLSPGSVMWNTSDTGWAKSAWSSVFAPWIQGACVFVHHMPRFEATTVLETLSRFQISTFCSAPTVYRMLVQEDLARYRFKSLQHCVSAGEPMNPEVMQQWKHKTGLEIYEGYGQTETVLICGTFKGMRIKPGSMGKPSPAYDVQIIDENCSPLPAGQEGDIAIRVKPNRPFDLFSGYTDDPERTELCYRGDFFLTGDRGVTDQDGYFWFVGRSDDVILSAGYRIGPFEVESALIEHPAVAESAVVSSPDAVRGEVVKAFVVLTPHYQHQDPQSLAVALQNHVKQVTAPYKYPRKIEFVESLPKTISGKIRRVELRNKEWGRT
ncbi:acyl-coenzyme A synthetase ACSM3, mitochondrial isoform X1 [Polyodon spathula]|uniref:acyl-coenzyme A synthetase ACSM3, mitochondrial isoform X1 n=1 Tax=Polyodon spathula TaxID=7913 RepID=UPI001B7EAED5|nr:acyl-coenzyme A synthetase ACSM3, mitochondrial isoform X1 [Polyodon spathula]XP_041133644.1 acyl-coenzyme A synthetase ACSM3, mitochondrial isoform X1 [Polyodon spathula]